MIERVRFETVTALRSLASTPGPAVAAIATLAVAAGVNLAMFGLINRALLGPPDHVTDAGRVFTVSFQITDVASEGRMTTTSPVTYAAVRDRVPAIAGAAAFQRNATSVVVEGEQRRVNAMLVSGTYLELLGARPWLGPGFSRADDAPGAPPAAVLSHEFWRAVFGSDRHVIGRRLFMRGLDYTVAGVMPEGFSGHSATGVDLWVPFAAALRNSPGWDRDAYRNFLSVAVRLAPGETREAAEAQATSAVGRRVRFDAIAGADVAATEQRVAWWLAGVSLLVLVIGLANAGTLLVVRAAKQRQQIAIRAALGASRERLVLQALVEAMVLALSATALSLLIAPWLDELVRRVLFPGLISETGLRASTVMAACGAGLLAAIVAAVSNLWQLPAQATSLDLAAAGRTGTRRGKTMTALLLVQTTLSVLLLAGAAMLAASFHNLASQDFGMRMDGVVIAEFESGPGTGVAGQGRLFEEALDRVRAMPRVQYATAIDAIPFGGFNVPPISVPGRDRPQVGGQLPHLIAATPDLLKILDVQVVEGRPLTEADGRGPLVVLVNSAMARGVWPGESAIGKCIRIGFDPDFDPATAAGPPMPSAAVPCREVIGVTRDVRYRSLVPTGNEARLMQYFVPLSQVPSPPFAAASGPPVRGLLLRTDAGAEALAAPLRRLIVGDRTDLPFLSVRPYAQLLDRQMRPWQLGTTLLVLFSSLALGVAAVGLYAAFAHAVTERRREMAIRIAIGARPGRVVRMVIREALVLAASGIALGWLAAIVAGRWVQALLFETQASDPLVLGAAAIVMLIVATAATILPARTAARADPNRLLRVQ
jgi:putative ABC transport system permease protein